MKFIFVLVTFFSSVSMAFNFNTDAYVQDQAWNDLLKKIADEGTSSDSGISELRALTQIFQIEADKEYKAVYLTASGRTNIMGEYVIFEVALTSEHWKLLEDGKTWGVDQWFYYMTSKGDLRYAVHNYIEKSENMILKNEKRPVGTPEEIEQSWSELMKLWLK